MTQDEFNDLFDKAFRRWQQGGNVGLRDCVWAAFCGKFAQSEEGTTPHDPQVKCASIGEAGKPGMSR